MSTEPPNPNPKPEPAPDPPRPDPPETDSGFQPNEPFEDPSHIERLYGEHIWGRKGKRATLIRWLWYPLWDLTTSDFKLWRFGTLPKEERVKLVKQWAGHMMNTPDFQDLPRKEEVIGRDKEFSVFLTSIYYHVLRDPEALKMRKPPPKVFLVKGEPGSGKSHLIKAVMRETFMRAVEEGFVIDLKTVQASSIMNEFMGGTTRAVGKTFGQTLTRPTFMYIDEANSLVNKGSGTAGGDSAGREMLAAESTMLQALDTLMRRPVRSLVVLASNTAENIREDIRRRCFLIDLDNPGLRRDDMVKIVAYLLKKYNISLDAEEVTSTLEQALRELGEGKMVPHDIERAFDIVVTESEKALRERFLEKIEGKSVESAPITLDSFKKCAKEVRTYKLQNVVQAVKEAEQSLPPAERYTDVGGLEDVKEDVIKEVNLSLNPMEAGDAWSPPRGYLFHGPPGTGKTLLAKAIAGENKVPFFYVRGPSLFAKWVGESEQGVRDLFKSARAKAPSIIFMDEIDAIGAVRGSRQGDAGVSIGVLTTLLSELDGFNPKGRIVFIGSTNRKDALDPALLERLDKQFLFQYPKTTAEKLDIIKAQFKKFEGVSGLTPQDIYKVFLKRTFSPRVSKDTIEAAARYAMMEQIACRKLLKAIDELDAPAQKQIRLHYRKEFKRIQDHITTNGTEEGFSLIDEYKQVADHNPLQLRHLERAFSEKAETEADKMEKLSQEMHRSSVGIPGKGYGLWANDEGKGGIGIVEAQIFPAAEGVGKGKVNVYGNVGKGTLESASMGKSFLRQYSPKISDLDIDLHFITTAEGTENVAVSGPSAGQVLMFTMLSAIIMEPFNPEICMTGKIDLKGTVGMVGGIQPKQNTGKLDASRAYGFKKILIPQTAYEEIVKEIPDYIDMSKEQGTEIVGGKTSWDYAQWVFPNLTKEQILEKLSKA
jgi:SpoVK/Ycf46/Vps4 family AAA+-type ATPase